MGNKTKERILQYLKSKCIAITRAEIELGWSKSSLLKSNNLTTDRISEFIRHFPDLNPSWLLTGEGEMLKGGEEGKPPLPALGSRAIRYWVDVDATGGGGELYEDTGTDRHIDIEIPEFRDCTDAVNLYGDSMSPLYRSGQIVILKEWTESFIEYGQIYLVITRNGNRMVKYLRKGSDGAHVLCVSENKDFDPFEIELANILKLYIVKGGIQKNAL